MLGITIFFLATALVFYCLFGGADFGAGIVEFFIKRPFRQKAEDLTRTAISPVWEANHVWLIVVIVVLFIAFPTAFYHYSVIFHVPLIIMLVGIVCRGCFFVFRNYDASSNRTHQLYSKLFVAASFITPLTMGLIAGGLINGVPPLTALELSYYDFFIRPWFNPFSFLLGLFFCGIVTFLAASYLLAETDEPDMQFHLRKIALTANFFVILCGGLVLLTAGKGRESFLVRFFEDPVSLTFFFIVTLLLFVHTSVLFKNKTAWARVIAGLQVLLILLAWFKTQYPVLLPIVPGEPITFMNAQAPDAVLLVLNTTLIVGCLLIFPALFFLLRVFKKKPVQGRVSLTSQQMPY